MQPPSHGVTVCDPHPTPPPLPTPHRLATLQMFVEALRRDTEALQYALAALQALHVTVSGRALPLHGDGDMGALPASCHEPAPATAHDMQSLASSSRGSGVGLGASTSSASAAWEVRRSLPSPSLHCTFHHPPTHPLPRIWGLQEGDDDDDGDFALEGLSSDVASKQMRA
jgi:hypothetical protein